MQINSKRYKVTAIIDRGKHIESLELCLIDKPESIFLLEGFFKDNDRLIKRLKMHKLRTKALAYQGDRDSSVIVSAKSEAAFFQDDEDYYWVAEFFFGLMAYQDYMDRGLPLMTSFPLKDWVLKLKNLEVEYFYAHPREPIQNFSQHIRAYIQAQIGLSENKSQACNERELFLLMLLSHFHRSVCHWLRSQEKQQHPDFDQYVAHFLRTNTLEPCSLLKYFQEQYPLKVGTIIREQLNHSCQWFSKAVSLV